MHSLIHNLTLNKLPYHSKLYTIVGLKINNSGKILFYKNENLRLKKKLTVIVETDKGLQFASVCITNVDKDVNLENGYVVRIANKKDYTQYMLNIRDAKNAVKKCREFVYNYGIEMNVMLCDL